jgi:hypothetical protein
METCRYIKVIDTYGDGRILYTSARVMSRELVSLSFSHLLHVRSCSSVVLVTCEYRVCGVLCKYGVYVK